MDTNQENDKQNEPMENTEEGAVGGEQPPSPRDAATTSKRTCTEERSQTPPPSAPFTGFMVPPSPPRFVSVEEVMKAAHGVSNMVLAHEIAVDNNFSIEKVEPPENSLEKRVKEVMHKAFWDVLDEKLKENPPDYAHALTLLQEVKVALLELLLPQHQKLKSHITEVLDIELIRQKAENNALDMSYYASFVIGLMSKLCAPARDEQVAKLKEIDGTVPLFKNIMELLELMKMDMANYTIQQIRPFIQQQSVEYEKKKFTEFLKTQAENNVDGLQFTRDWLYRSFEQLQCPESPREGAASTPELTPGEIINQAYMELLKWDERRTMPETLLMDAGRISDCRDEITRLTVISSVLLVTYNTIGAPIAGVKDLKQKLKEHVSIILADTPSDKLSSLMENVAEQVIQEVVKSLQQHGFPTLDEKKRSLLRSQIKAITDDGNPVYTIIQKRIHTLVQTLISSARPDRVQLPAGVSAVAEELNKVCGQFLRVITHNRAVFSSHYVELIKAMMFRADQVD